jgi:hypothetical protein
VFECVLARQNSPVSDRIAQEVCGKISFLCNDAKKFVVSIHDKALHELVFFRSDRPRAVEHVLEFSAFENHGSESDLVKQLLVIQRLNNDADTAGDGGIACH